MHAGDEDEYGAAGNAAGRSGSGKVVKFKVKDLKKEKTLEEGAKAKI